MFLVPVFSLKRFVYSAKKKWKKEVTPVPVSGTMSWHALSVVHSLASAILLLLLGC